MPRKPRVSLAGVPEHIIQRGNNRQAIFACDEDMKSQCHLVKILCQAISRGDPRLGIDDKSRASVMHTE